MRDVSNRGYASEVWIPTTRVASVGTRPYRTRALFASPSIGHRALALGRMHSETLTRKRRVDRERELAIACDVGGSSPEWAE